jgi:hypothetical protein
VIQKQNHSSKFAPGNSCGDAAGMTGWANGGSAGNVLVGAAILQ